MTHPFHETHLVDSSPSCKAEESYLLNNHSMNVVTSDQTIDVVNIDFYVTIDGGCMHSSINLTKPMIFNDLSFEGLQVCQDGEEI